MMTKSEVPHGPHRAARGRRRGATRPGRTRLVSVLLEIALALVLPGASSAHNHLIQLEEVMAGCGGDPSLQFVEIVFPPGQGLWGGCTELAFFDAADVQTAAFAFPTNVPDDSRAANSALIATRAFADLPGAPAPDFIMPPAASAPGGKICFREVAEPAPADGHLCFPVHICLSYGNFQGDTDGAGAPAAPLPVDATTSLQRIRNFGSPGQGTGQQHNADFEPSSPTPRNDLGVAGRVVADGGACHVVPACPGTDLGSARRVSFRGTTHAAPDLFAGSCGGHHASDATFLYTAPEAGTYAIDTRGSTSTTVLYVRDGTCDGPELACSPASADHESLVVVDLRAGQRIVITVDGLAQESGDFVLNVATPCRDVPLAGCVTASPGAGLLLLRSVPGGDRNLLRWKWKGDVTPSEAAFGNPVAATDYALCLYSTGDLPALALAARAPASGVCAGSPCWKRTRSGFEYRDPELTPDGLRSVSLATNGRGRTKIGLEGRGALLVPPTLPVGTPLVAQLYRGGGACWEATYSAAQQSDGTLKAKSDDTP